MGKVSRFRSRFNVRTDMPQTFDGYERARLGYNVQVAVDTEHHLIVTHEVTNTGSDRSQLANVASQAKDVLGADHLDVVADRGYFNSTEILACEQATLRGSINRCPVR
jgi:hypothetical protein